MTARTVIATELDAILGVLKSHGLAPGAVQIVFTHGEQQTRIIVEMELDDEPDPHPERTH